MPRFALPVALLCAALLPTATLAQQDKFFDSNGVRLRYVEQGQGQPIVLLHGNGNTLQSWIDAGVFKNLAADFRVIGFDARGHGKSAKPHDPKQYGPESRGANVVDRQRAAAVTVPTLGIVGTLDGNLARLQELKKLRPSLQLVIIDGAVHGSGDARGTMRHPRFVAAIREFIAAQGKSTQP